MSLLEFYRMKAKKPCSFEPLIKVVERMYTNTTTITPIAKKSDGTMATMCFCMTTNTSTTHYSPIATKFSRPMLNALTNDKHTLKLCTSKATHV